ncbi:unnamed protein product, partial [Symbiodinium sp. CCMP2456]
VQRKAENAQSAVRPEIEERLQKVKMEVDQQKRLNVKLQADRLKLSNQRKAIEEEIRKVGSELRSKAALLHRKGPTGQEKGSQTVLEQLRREIDILRGALRQDERKHRAMLKEDSQEVGLLAGQLRYFVCGSAEGDVVPRFDSWENGKAEALVNCLVTARKPTAKSLTSWRKDHGLVSKRASRPRYQEADVPVMTCRLASRAPLAGAGSFRAGIMVSVVRDAPKFEDALSQLATLHAQELETTEKELRSEIARLQASLMEAEALKTAATEPRVLAAVIEDIAQDLLSEQKDASVSGEDARSAGALKMSKQVSFGAHQVNP